MPLLNLSKPIQGNIQKGLAVPEWDWFWRSRRLSVLFDEGGGTVRDAVRHDRQATITGAPTWNPAGPFLSYDGVDDSSTFPDAPYLDLTNNVTCIIRLRFDANSSGFESVFAKRNGTVDTNYAINFSSASNFQWYYRVNSGAERVVSANWASNFSNGIWYTIVGVFRQAGAATDGFMYKDGVELASSIGLLDNITPTVGTVNLDLASEALNFEPPISISCFHLLDAALIPSQVRQISLDPWAPFRRDQRFVGRAVVGGVNVGMLRRKRASSQAF